MQPFPVLQVAKVLGIHRHGHTVDVILLNGGTILEDVPLLGWGGSDFGLSGLVAPTSDREILGQKTYPPGDRANFLYPRANTEMPRDIYVVIAQIEGSQRGLTGAVALGMIYPTVSEMHLPGDLYPDFLLFRHPADVQATIDRYGSTSLQHPTGARIMLEHATPVEAIEGQEGEISEPTPPPAVDLAVRDLHQLYRLRANIPASFALGERAPSLFVRIPKFFLDDSEEAGGGTVTEGVDPEKPEIRFVRSAAAFPTDLGEIEIPEDPLIALVMKINGEQTRVVRAAKIAGGDTVLVVSPPLLAPPPVGASFTLQRVPVLEVGEVYAWLDKTGDLYLKALWNEPVNDEETVIRGKIREHAGELHDKLVEAGDIFETAHPAEETGGNIRNRADTDHQTSAGQVNRMENDAGVVLVMAEDGTAKLSAPGDIWITAGGVLHLDGTLIEENMNGASAGDEGTADQGGGDGEDNGGMFPPGIGMGGGGMGGGGGGGFPFGGGGFSPF